MAGEETSMILRDASLQEEIQILPSSGPGIVIHARMPAITFHEGNPELRPCVKGQNQVILPAVVCYNPVRSKLEFSRERYRIPDDNNQW